MSCERWPDTTLRQLCKEFIKTLEKEEESDSGVVFRPNQISSCRVMDGSKLENILKRIKEICND